MDPQNQTPIMTPGLTPHEEKSIGPAIGIIIIIVVIVLGGLYFWGQRLEMRSPATTENPPVENTQVSNSPAELQEIQSQSSADDTAAIEADLNATNVDSLGTEMNSVDAEAQTQ